MEAIQDALVRFDAAGYFADQQQPEIGEKEVVQTIVVQRDGKAVQRQFLADLTWNWGVHQGVDEARKRFVRMWASCYTEVQLLRPAEHTAVHKDAEAEARCYAAIDAGLIPGAMLDLRPRPKASNAQPPKPGP